MACKWCCVMAPRAARNLIISSDRGTSSMCIRAPNSSSTTALSTCRHRSIEKLSSIRIEQWTRVKRAEQE